MFINKGLVRRVSQQLCVLHKFISGMNIPPMVIFESARLNERLAETPMHSLVRDLFAEWFQHFIKCIPSHRSVFVFMDSHASHITPEILSKISDNGVHRVTFPSHTMHLLPPLDVCAYRPLKKGWKKEVEKFLTEHPGAKPDCCDFNRLLASAYRGAFQSTRVCNSFAETGLLPFNRDAISDEAITPPLVTESKDTNDNEPGTTSGENKRKSSGVIWDTLQMPVRKTRRKTTRNILLDRYFQRLGKQHNPHRPYPPLRKKMTKIMTLVVHVEDCIRMTLRRKIGLNGLSVHFVEYGITQHTKKLWMNSISCVMSVRIPTTVNKHTICIQKDNIGNLCFQTNSHGLRKTATHVYSYLFSSVLVIFCMQ